MRCQAIKTLAASLRRLYLMLYCDIRPAFSVLWPAFMSDVHLRLGALGPAEMRSHPAGNHVQNKRHSAEQTFPNSECTEWREIIPGKKIKVACRNWNKCGKYFMAMR
jgi:hypothetical protein